VFNEVGQGAKAFARMHSHLVRTRIPISCSLQVKALIPSSFCNQTAAKKQHVVESNQKSFVRDTNAGVDAGVFFGRLIRPFGTLPSGRISGPSAEFISVTRLRPGASDAMQYASPVLQPLCAPMNNPFRRQRAEGGRVSLNPGT
jgi:hypothetical protein